MIDITTTTMRALFNNLRSLDEGSANGPSLRVKGINANRIVNIKQDRMSASSLNLSKEQHILKGLCGISAFSKLNSRIQNMDNKITKVLNSRIILPFLSRIHRIIASIAMNMNLGSKEIICLEDIIKHHNVHPTRPPNTTYIIFIAFSNSNIGKLLILSNSE